MRGPGIAMGWLLAGSAGLVWGVAFFSWGLPIPVPLRVGGTVLLVLALAATGRPGRQAAAAFSLGMGVTSLWLGATSGALGSVWTLVPAAALVAGVALLVMDARAGPAGR